MLPAPSPHIIVHFPKRDEKGSHVCQKAEENSLMYKEQQALCSPLFALGFLLFVLNLACWRLSAAPLPEGHVQTCQVLGVGAEQRGRFNEKSAARGSGGAQAAFFLGLCASNCSLSALAAAKASHQGIVMWVKMVPTASSSSCSSPGSALAPT